MENNLPILIHEKNDRENCGENYIDFNYHNFLEKYNMMKQNYKNLKDKEYLLKYNNLTISNLQLPIIESNKILDKDLIVFSSAFKNDESLQSLIDNFVDLNCESKGLIIFGIWDSMNNIDNYFEIVNRNKELYPDIKIISINFDPGLYECWNASIQISNSKYLTNLNLDDYINKEWFVKISKEMKDKYVIGTSLYRAVNNNDSKKYLDINWDKEIPTKDYSLWFMYKNTKIDENDIMKHKLNRNLNKEHLKGYCFVPEEL